MTEWLNWTELNAETETPILWPPDAKSWLIGRDPDAGKDWRQKEKGTEEDEMVGWHHWFNGHEFEQAPGDGEGQGDLACCSPWGLQIVRHEWAIEQQQQQMVTCEIYFEGRADGFADGLAMEWEKERTRGWIFIIFFNINLFILIGGWIFRFLAWVTWQMVAPAHWNGETKAVFGG